MKPTKLQKQTGRTATTRLFGGRFLLVLYILVPLLIVTTGWAAWITTTPSIDVSTTGSFVADRIINTNALLEVTAFDQYELYYAGPVQDGKIQSEFVVESTINLKLNNLHTLSAETDGVLYLRMVLSLTDGAECDIFGAEEGGVWSTHFTSPFSAASLDGVAVSVQSTDFTSSSYQLVLKLDFTAISDGATLANSTITPSFILDAEGYPLLFDLVLEDPNLTFRLDLKLTETP